jgi:uncharacterized membrane protein SirB2
MSGTLKAVHVGAVAVSGIGFVLRYALLKPASNVARSRWARVAPHVVDVILLASGVGLAWTLRVNPLHQPWLGAKLAALAIYILLGSIALERGRTTRQRALAFGAAVACYAYIVSVALTHDPRGVLGLLG